MWCELNILFLPRLTNYIDDFIWLRNMLGNTHRNRALQHLLPLPKRLHLWSTYIDPYCKWISTIHYQLSSSVIRFFLISFDFYDDAHSYNNSKGVVSNLKNVMIMVFIKAVRYFLWWLLVRQWSTLESQIIAMRKPLLYLLTNPNQNKKSW